MSDNKVKTIKVWAQIDDGPVFNKSLLLDKEELNLAGWEVMDGIREMYTRPYRMIETLTRAIGLTICKELGRLGEPAFELFKDRDKQEG